MGARGVRRARQVTIYTIGHGSRSRETFLQLLQRHRIQLLVDVRRWPTSKTTHFKQELLEQWLRHAGVNYSWIGEDLGGFRREGYEAYMRTAGFKRGVAALLALAEVQTVCVMCLEISPRGCHRRFIAEALRRRGASVIDIIK